MIALFYKTDLGPYTLAYRKTKAIRVDTTMAAHRCVRLSKRE